MTQGAETYEPRVATNGLGVRLAMLSPTTRYDVHVVAADVARGNVQPAIATLSFHTPPTRRYLESEYVEACAEEWHDGAQERMTWEFERVKADGSMSDSDLVNYAAELNALFATCRSVDKHRGRGSVMHGEGGARDTRRTTTSGTTRAVGFKRFVRPHLVLLALLDATDDEDLKI